MSPILFILYLGTVLSNIPQENYMTESFAYADDIAQTARTKEELKEFMGELDNGLQQRGLKLSYLRTKYMAIGRDVAWT